MSTRASSAAILICLALVFSGHITSAREPRMSPDEQAVLAVVDAFHRALETGDSLKVMALLSEDAVVLEHGVLESRVEYAAHHLADDVQNAVNSERWQTAVRTKTANAVAWISSVSEVRGKAGVRRGAEQVAETMVLTRSESGWRIAVIHWSSRPVLRRIGPPSR